MNSSEKFGSVEIKHSDVIKLILQYLQENNYLHSFTTLQKESKISLNTIDKDNLHQMIIHSEWNNLFKALNYLMPSQQNLFDLYELIADDLIEKDCFLAATYIINQCMKGSNSELFSSYKERILRLQYICENISQKALYQNPPSESRRKGIIARLLKETHQQVQKSRLLKLLGEALKFQSFSGLIKPNISMSLFQNKQHQLAIETQELIKTQDKLQKYNEESRISAIKISHKGEYIALAGLDGLIEIYDPIQYTLHTGLAFQADDVMLYHDDPVTHLQFSQTDEMLLSADIKGFVKIWSLQTGKLLRKFQYQTAVGAVIWGNDPSHILVGYQNIKLYGIRGCNVLKQYIAGSSTISSNENEYILQIFCSANKVFSLSQNSTIRVYNYRTQQQINYLTNHNTITLKCLPLYNSSNQLRSFLVCTQKKLIEYDEQLLEIGKFTLTEQSSKYINFVCVGNYIYECILNQMEHSKTKSYKLQVREKKTGKIIYFCAVQNRMTIMQLQKFRNLLVTYNEEDSLEFWRP